MKWSSQQTKAKSTLSIDIRRHIKGDLKSKWNNFSQINGMHKRIMVTGNGKYLIKYILIP